MKSSASELGLNRCSYFMKFFIEILGIVFDFHMPSRMKANFDSILKSIKNLLNLRKWRGLTLLGKIQIVKSLIKSNVLSKAALISVSEDLIKGINSFIYGFIWNGNDKIKSRIVGFGF